MPVRALPVWQRIRLHAPSFVNRGRPWLGNSPARSARIRSIHPNTSQPEVRGSDVDFASSHAMRRAARTASPTRMAAKCHSTLWRVVHSTVTLFARLRGLSTSVPRAQAVWYASSCSGTTCSIGLSAP